MLRANRLFLDVDPLDARNFINGTASQKEGRFNLIVEWIKAFVKPLD